MIKTDGKIKPTKSRSEIIKKEKTGVWVAISENVAVFISESTDAEAIGNGLEKSKKMEKLIELRSKIKSIK